MARRLRWAEVWGLILPWTPPFLQPGRPQGLRPCPRRAGEGFSGRWGDAAGRGYHPKPLT